jgi:hypothetical protein
VRSTKRPTVLFFGLKLMRGSIEDANLGRGASCQQARWHFCGASPLAS